MADMDSLFTGQIPTKVLISLVSNEAFISTWQKNPFNFAHIELNSACLVLDGRPIPAQPWQPDFMQGLYDETYPALLKFSGMYPSYWSNGMSVEQFVGGSMLLSWDLMPDDINGVAYLSPRHLGTVKASLRFAKPLPSTTTLIAYAQYDNLVVVDAYRTVTFNYNVWCFGWELLEAQKRERLAARGLFGVYTTGTCLHGSWTANERPGNTPVRLLCGASLMQVVLYSIAPKNNLHHTSVYPLTFSAGLTSLYHQQQWLLLMTRTVLVKAAAGALPWLAS